MSRPNATIEDLSGNNPLKNPSVLPSMFLQQKDSGIRAKVSLQFLVPLQKVTFRIERVTLCRIPAVEIRKASANF